MWSTNFGSILVIFASCVVGIILVLYYVGEFYGRGPILLFYNMYVYRLMFFSTLMVGVGVLYQVYYFKDVSREFDETSCVVGTCNILLVCG